MAAKYGSDAVILVVRCRSATGIDAPGRCGGAWCGSCTGPAVLQKLPEIIAAVQGRFHCWLKHGAVGPARDTHFGHLEIFCPICGRVFWHDHARA